MKQQHRVPLFAIAAALATFFPFFSISLVLGVALLVVTASVASRDFCEVSDHGSVGQ